MVVLPIMAILLAIAIPTFLGVKGGASDRPAQSNADTALKEAVAVFGNNNQSWFAEESSAGAFTSAGPSSAVEQRLRRGHRLPVPSLAVAPA